MSGQTSTELARAIVTQVVPSELPLFPAMSRIYANNPDKVHTRGGRDEALGFGLAEEASLLTPVILVAVDAIGRYLAEDIGKTLAHTAIDAVVKWIRGLVHREPDGQPLSQVQITKIRTIVLEVARTMGVAEPSASALADAAVLQLTGVPTAAS